MSLEAITKAITDLEENEVLKLVKEKLDAGEDPLSILDACRLGMAEIGKGAGDTIFLTDLIMAGEIFNEAMEILMPKLAGSSTKSLGKVVIGTVKAIFTILAKTSLLIF